MTRSRTKRPLIPLLLLPLVLGCETTPTVPDNPLVVIRAYLYAGDPVTDIQVSSTLPLGSEDAVGAPINDAVVTLIRRGARYGLAADGGDSGFYRYPGTDLVIVEGDTFNLEVAYGNRTATARTVVPQRPTGITLSRADVVIPEFGGRGFGGGGFNSDELSLLVRWPNPASSLFFVAVQNVDPNPEEVDATNPFGQRFRFISTPTAADSFRVVSLSLTQYGHYQVNLFRVNEEYAQLYASRQQDSRDLNEPFTNITNGLGIFSAFSSVKGFFEAKKPS